MTSPERQRTRAEVHVRAMRTADWPTVAAIYRQGIDTGDATFESGVPAWDAWDAARLPGCRLVAEAGDLVVGFAALSPVSRRPVYAGVAEDARGRGLGGRLLTALVEHAEAAGLWTLQAGIFPENAASIALHRRAGFRVLGTRERIGCADDGRWRDVVVMERRSDVVGVDPIFPTE